MSGMNGLRAIRGVREVEFPLSIKDGVFHTMVKPEITKYRRGGRRFKCKGAFRICDLPSELRNQIYSELLVVPGVLYPTNRTPTSAAALAHYQYEEDQDKIRAKAPKSVLEILAVNKQMHDEAIGIFYWNNDFLFSWPSEMQSFIISLGANRMKFVRDITLFYKDHREGNTQNYIRDNSRSAKVVDREARLSVRNAEAGTDC